MKVGDLVLHYGDSDIGIILAIKNNDLKPSHAYKKGSVLVYFPEEASKGWYTKQVLKVISESR